MNPTETQDERITVRGLRPQDLEAVIGLDARSIGRRREEYFKLKLQQNLLETGIKVSLAAERDGMFCGFLLARVSYGEFGVPEPVALLETLAVHPGYRRAGVGSAMFEQLCLNLRGLGVDRLQTVVGWDDGELMAFFRGRGFRPAPQFCLDLPLTRPR